MRVKHWLLLLLILCSVAWARPGLACSGYIENGHCYILSAPGQSCTATCQPYGGCNATALRSITDGAACQSALDKLLALQHPKPVYEFVNPRGIVGGGLGCFAFKAGFVHYGVRNVIRATCNRGYGTAERVCACGN